jgi:hypothetical protein
MSVSNQMRYKKGNDKINTHISSLFSTLVCYFISWLGSNSWDRFLFNDKWSHYAKLFGMHLTGLNIFHHLLEFQKVHFMMIISLDHL